MFNCYFPHGNSEGGQGAGKEHWSGTEQIFFWIYPFRYLTLLPWDRLFLSLSGFQIPGVFKF